MEQIIGKLLENFENGKISRRQLVQNLTTATAAAMAVTPALAAPALGASAPAAKGFKCTTVNHLSYNVADFGKTREFYVDLLGMKASHDNGKQCFLEFGNSFIVARNARDGRAAGTIDHVAYTIETWDKDAVEAELKRRGLDPKPDTPDSFHIKDPDGFDVQIAGPNLNPKNY